jgi:hypothetical protein
MEKPATRLFLMAFFVMAFSVSSYSQRDWEGVTLEYDPIADTISATKGFSPLIGKFWMDFNHGVVRVSSSNNDSIQRERSCYYYSGSYMIHGDTLTVNITSRRAILINLGAIDISKEVRKELTPPLGEIPEQYNFLITKEDTTGLELLSFNSFFRLKDNERQFYKEEQRNISLSLAIVDNKYPWLTEEEFQSKVIKKAVCRGVNGSYIMSIE